MLQGEGEDELVQSKEPEKEMKLRSGHLGVTDGGASAVRSINLEEC